MSGRRDTRTWHPERPKEPTPIVRDPAMRAVLEDRRRALLAEVASIEKHLGMKAEEELPQAS